MNGTQILREHDPKYLRRRRWERRSVILVALLAVIAVVGAGFAIASTIKVENRVTKVEQSACADAQADPTDLKALHECQVIRAAAEHTANQNVNCIPFRRAGYICPKPGSPLAEEHRSREIREAVGPHGDAQTSATPATPTAPHTAATGGDATSSPHHTGSSQAGPHGSGGSRQVDGGSHGVKASPEKLPPTAGGEPGAGTSPPASPAPSPSQQPSSTTTEPTETVVVPAAPEAAPVREGLGGVLNGVGTTVEAAGATVEETGSTVNQTLEGVTCAVHLTC